MKVKGILDEVLNEDVAGVLGFKERSRYRYKTVTVNVLNNGTETFQSMPLDVRIKRWRVHQIMTCP